MPGNSRGLRYRTLHNLLNHVNDIHHTNHTDNSNHTCRPDHANDSNHAFGPNHTDNSNKSNNTYRPDHANNTCQSRYRLQRQSNGRVTTYRRSRSSGLRRRYHR